MVARWTRCGTHRFVLFIACAVLCHTLACGSASVTPSSGGIATPSTPQLPPGGYSSIDTQREIQAITALRSGNTQEAEPVAREVMAHPDRYCPAVFYSLASYLFTREESDSAIFWMYAGRIRTSYDIRRSKDQTVADAGQVLNQQLPELLRLLQFENLEQAKKIVGRAIEWDRVTKYNYDARWIALHGLGASLPGADSVTSDSMLVSPAEWSALAERNRTEYLAGFLEDVAAITPEHLEQIRSKIEELRNAGDPATAR